MKEFAFIFRNSESPSQKLSPQEMQQVLLKWQEWMGSMQDQGKIVSRGNRLGDEGRTVRPNNLVTNGPYTEIKEFISGFIVVQTATIEEAAELAKGCPILSLGGNVEVRNVIPANG